MQIHDQVLDQFMGKQLVKCPRHRKQARLSIRCFQIEDAGQPGEPDGLLRDQPDMDRFVIACGDQWYPRKLEGEHSSAR